MSTASGGRHKVASASACCALGDDGNREVTNHWRLRRLRYNQFVFDFCTSVQSLFIAPGGDGEVLGQDTRARRGSGLRALWRRTVRAMGQVTRPMAGRN